MLLSGTGSNFPIANYHCQLSEKPPIFKKKIELEREREGGREKNNINKRGMKAASEVTCHWCCSRVQYPSRGLPPCKGSSSR